ncbi:MAG: 4'-phosphopantetheinyl transferase superfamily protein [Acidobacteria bacterium]|nr:4'-phosphopantetheinyl transferase superfamily protein [Acidobacteriota bacterium]
METPLVELWQIDVFSAPPEPAWRVLSTAEREHSQRFHRADDRLRSAATRAALRHILSAHLDLRPEQIEFTTGPHGKPEVQGSGIEFNCTHSGDWAWIAVIPGVPVGVDLERIHEIETPGAIMDAHASQQELQCFHVVPPGRQADAFFTWWTRKEAYLKALGKGLDDELRTATAWSGTRAPQVVNSWCVASMESPPGYCGAVAVGAPAFRVDSQLFRWP